MKFKTYIKEALKINTRQTSGTMYGVVSSFDQKFKDKKLKKSVTLNDYHRSYNFEKGSLVSNIAGGVFIKMKNRKDEPDSSNEEWGVMITTSKKNLAKLIKAL